MLKAFQNRMKDDKGFTLIELMVVVLIIAILLAIAIPTFLRIRRNAQDRQAQSSVQTAFKAEKAFYVDGSNNVYSEDGAALEQIESSVNYFTTTNPSCAGFSAGPKCVKIVVADVGTATDQQVLLIGQSRTETYWAMKDVSAGTSAGTFYNAGGDTGEPAATDVVDQDW